MLLGAAGGAHKLLISFWEEHGEHGEQEQKCNIFDAFMVHKNAKILYNIDVTNILKRREKIQMEEIQLVEKQGIERKKYWKG